MAHVYMKKINDDEYIGIEKLSSSDVYRSFNLINYNNKCNTNN